MPITSYRHRIVETDPPALAATMETVTIPLMPHPRLEEVERLRAQYETDLDAARATGDTGKVKVAYYQAAWARKIEAQLRDGTAPTEVRGPVHAVRIGDGVVVTGPGETFTEYGIAVKERSPGVPTLYAGYTNEMLGYLPTCAEYAFGGYEAGYGYKSVGLPSRCSIRASRKSVSGPASDSRSACFPTLSRGTTHAVGLQPGTRRVSRHQHPWSIRPRTSEVQPSRRDNPRYAEATSRASHSCT
jgi:hypothetical protein